MNREIVILQRDTMAYMVPSGARIMLHSGTEVKITQSLGDSFTVDVYGNLARIDGNDADALGKEKLDPLAGLPEGASAEDVVWLLLKTVYDPEIPVNIVDLGLVYNLITKKISNNNYYIEIKMTLTAPGCGMGPVIAQDVEDKVLGISFVEDVLVEVVWEPLWNQDMMTEEAKLKLGMM